MSEEQRATIAKAKLPTETKIAVWWLIVVGNVLTFWSLGLLFFAFCYSLGSTMDAGPEVPNLVLYFFLPFYGIFMFLSFVFLSTKGKKAWAITVIILVITIICFLGLNLYSLANHVYYMITLISFLEWLSCLFPLSLIILDRKNYFKMVHQRELEKKDSE